MPDPLFKLQETLEREASGAEKPLLLPWSRLNFALGGGLRPETLSLLVGEPGSCKTLLALAACLAAYQDGRSWCYWPFERDDAYAARRLLAVLLDRWSVLDAGDGRENAALLENEEIFAHMARMTTSIEPNPRQLRRDGEGNFFVPDCGYREILDRLRQLCSERELVILDPLSMLSFNDGGRDEWKGQENFAKDAAAIVAGTRARLMLVHHTRKSSPGGKARPAGLDEVAGAAALSRFADNVIFVEHHPDGLESDVMLAEGYRKVLTHRRTLFVAKARDGKGTGWRIACDLGENGPALVEHGLIQRKAAK